ncbi:MAG: hypothetical protein GY719_10490 [bacterium]|nr:hypothetical protein [bacterium]
MKRGVHSALGALPHRNFTEHESRSIKELVAVVKESALPAIVAVLELIGSEHPPLLHFQLDTLLRSTTRIAVHDLASGFAVPLDQVAQTIHKACLDLDNLERKRGVWKDPTLFLQSPNVVALLHVCQARAGRTTERHRRRKLEVIERRLRAAHELARSRAWIEAFIGPPVLERAGAAAPGD